MPKSMLKKIRENKNENNKQTMKYLAPEGRFVYFSLLRLIECWPKTRKKVKIKRKLT